MPDRFRQAHTGPSTGELPPIASPPSARELERRRPIRPPKPTRLRRTLSAAKYYGLGLYNNVDDDHCFLYAAGIAFNVLLSVIPLSLLLLGVFSTVLRNNAAAASNVIQYITDSVPVPAYKAAVGELMLTQFNSISKGGSLVGLIGALTLLWLSSALFSTLRTAVNAVFRLRPKSNVVYLKLADFVLTFIVMALLLISMLIVPIANAILKFGTAIFPAAITHFASTAMPWLISLAVSMILYWLLFRVLPYERLPRKVVWVAAITTMVLAEAAKYAFAFYMTKATSIGALYGAYAFIVGIALWTFYMASVFMIGAEVGWLYWIRREQLTPEGTPAVAAHA